MRNTHRRVNRNGFDYGIVERGVGLAGALTQQFMQERCGKIQEVRPSICDHSTIRTSSAFLNKAQSSSTQF